MDFPYRVKLYLHFSQARLKAPRSIWHIRYFRYLCSSLKVIALKPPLHFNENRYEIQFAAIRRTTAVVAPPRVVHNAGYSRHILAYAGTRPVARQ